MKNVIKTHRVCLALIPALMVVGLLAGCTSSDSENTNSSIPETAERIVETTNPTTDNTTIPSTEPTNETMESTTDTPTTAPPITFTDVNETVYATGTVNVRIASNTDSEKLGRLSKGDSVTRIAIGDNGWSRVEYNGQTAYIYSQYLSTIKPSRTESSNSNKPSTSTSTNSSGFADPSTGISWDGVSPIIYTYPDGTTGTTPKEGATYEMLPGVITTYIILRDASGRATGDICQICGKKVSINTQVNSSSYCKHYGWSSYCDRCGAWVEAYTCHDCIDHFDGVFYCDDCGKICGDGSNGTCVRWLVGGKHSCTNCGATVSAGVCHTCNEN